MKKMKFLLGALSFVAVAFMVSPSQAQIKTYLSEDFETGHLDGTVWNLSACTPISTQTGPLFFLNDGSSVFGSYIYDPNGNYMENGSKTVINGLYELISMPFSFDANVANYISVDLRMLSTKQLSDRKFGIRLREKNDTQWDTVKEISLNTTEYQESLLLAIDDRWAGKSDVELGLYFYNKHDKESSFLFLMDNLRCAAYSLTPTVNTDLIATPITYGDTCTIKLAISNASMDTINSIEYVYTIDEDVKSDTISVILENALAPMKTITRVIPIALKGIELGNHTLKLMPPYKINGNTVTNAIEDTLVWEFTLLDAALLTQNYVPLMECFTASWCGPCANMNRYLNPTLAELKEAGKINVIKYQSYGDKYYISASETRCDVYQDIDGYGYIPFPIYNGEANITSWNSNYSKMMTILNEKATEDHNKKALAAIEITKAEADAQTKRLTLSFSVTTAFTGEVSVFAAVTEKTTTGNKGSNGEREFHYVAMDMPTTGSGKKTAFEASKEKVFNYGIDLDQTNMEEITDLEVVCFVQNLETKEIFQSASADVLAINVANEYNLSAHIAMYPNPAKEQVTLQGMRSADITICDLTGRVVYSVKGAEESLNINLDSFTAGTYMVRISQNGQTAHKKLMVIK